MYVENENKLNRKKFNELKSGPLRIIEKISESFFKMNTGRKKSESNLFQITKLIPIEEEGDKKGNEEYRQEEGLLMELIQ